MIFKYVEGMSKDCVLRMQGYYMVGGGSNLVDVFVPSEVFGNMNS